MLAVTLTRCTRGRAWTVRASSIHRRRPHCPARQRSPNGTPVSAGGAASARTDLQTREEVGDLEGGGFCRVGAVHGIGLDGRGELLADGAWRRLGRIGGAHEIAPALDAALGLEDH